MHESVELVKRARKKSAVPFANAVLRKLAAASLAKAGQVRETETPVLENAAGLSQRFAHPLWLVDVGSRQFGLVTTRKDLRV